LLQRDVRDLSNVEQLAFLPNLLKILATRVGGMYNSSDIARDSGLPNSTLIRYITLLETLFLIDKVPAWFSNFGKRLVKSPKLYFSDTGIASYLLGLDIDSLDRNSIYKGSLLENLVYLELKKQSSWSKIKPQIYYLRTSDGETEVDFILEARNGRKIGIEVKAASSLNPKDWKHLVSLQEKVSDVILCIVFYTGEQVIPLGKNIWAIPINQMWRE
jgi:uncharacterized protein